MISGGEKDVSICGVTIGKVLCYSREPVTLTTVTLVELISPWKPISTNDMKMWEGLVEKKIGKAKEGVMGKSYA